MLRPIQIQILSLLSLASIAGDSSTKREKETEDVICMYFWFCSLHSLRTVVEDVAPSDWEGSRT